MLTFENFEKNVIFWFSGSDFWKFLV